VVMALVLWRWEWLRFTFLGAAAALDGAHLFPVLSYWYFFDPLMFFFHIFITAVAAAIFFFFAGGKKMGYYFLVGYLILMGLPFFFLLGWLLSVIDIYL